MEHGPHLSRLREHFGGQPKRWLEESRLAQLGFVPGRARTGVTTAAAKPSMGPRVWLRPMVTDSFFPKLIVRRGQRLMAALDRRIAKERPRGKAVYKLTHETTKALDRLELILSLAGSELETGAREAIADDIDFILKKHGYDLDLEEALGPRRW